MPVTTATKETNSTADAANSTASAVSTRAVDRGADAGSTVSPSSVAGILMDMIVPFSGNTAQPGPESRVPA